MDKKIYKKYWTRLPLDRVRNTRDLGGYLTDKGYQTKWKSFIRSEDIYDFTKGELIFLENYGIKTVIDLRSITEKNLAPNPIKNIKNFDYYHIPFDLEQLYSMEQTTNALESFYTYLLRQYTKMASIFRIILTAKPGGILFHCKVGKDRTGVISMLLLAIAGVSKEDIYANYEISNTYLKEAYTPAGRIIKKNEVPLALSDKKLIEYAYYFILDTFGSIEKYFIHLGLSIEEIQLLKYKIVEFESSENVS
ncbi:tyrosine-protein phosphatase [Herbivorax sp. ANBcel31]|uniref:tyrosine-protein phosphatase n=1 Tax=Herbivorax sp. ANBcel31 TaxID=3069754 RepID=UPI0027B4DFE8|nr:tyrosine-protein phosphatase [Herbivorax sp. ANBcel31]MDQ2086761.1 tyrosine-protein phosphatase [Herbivorax sp. ANBcel31]